jgi:hypothetical protein
MEEYYFNFVEVLELQVANPEGVDWCYKEKKI